MSDGANKAFLANPVGWMRQNLLILDIQTGGTDTSRANRGYILKYDQGALVTCKKESKVPRVMLHQCDNNG
jgi:hypothetical protein